MTRGEKIKEWRRELGREWTQEKLAEALKKAGADVDRNWVAAVETDRMRKPFLSLEVQALARVFKKPMPQIFDELGAVGDSSASMVREGGSALLEVTAAMQSWVNVPIMGRAPAGEPREAFENFLGYYPAPGALVRGDAKRYIFVKAVGESMIGLQIRDGDNMLVHLQEEAADGDVVIAHVEGDGVTCKTFRVKKGVPSLEAANPAHKPLPLKPFRIVGKVIWRGG